MKILAFNGSPRKRGNTDILIDEFTKGIQKNGHELEKIYLYPIKINPCMDCRKCKQPPFLCALNDDMDEVYNKIDSSDAIVFATPIYFYGPTAKMKLLIERLRPYIENKKLTNKKGILIIPSEEGKVACKTTLESFLMSFTYLGMRYEGIIYGTAYDKGEIANNKNELNFAYNFGKNL